MSTQTRNAIGDQVLHHETKMKGIVHRLNEIGATITRLLEVSTAAGASVGVLHHNQVVFSQSYGYRDIERKLTADDETIYHVASLTKSFTATALNMAVSEKRLHWNQTMAEILPSFTHTNQQIRKESILLDLLAHRTGLASKNAIWLQDWTELLLQKEDVISSFSYLETVQPFRTGFLYNNWGYAVAAAALEQVEQKSWVDSLRLRIFEPLGLSRTLTGPQVGLDNQAKGYLATSDGVCHPVEDPAPAAGTVMQGGIGLRSCVKDLLKYYAAVLQGTRKSMFTGKAQEVLVDTPILGDLRQLFIPHTQIDPKDETKGHYGMGWILAELPARLGSVGTNPGFIHDMALVGKGTSKKRLWYHNGSLVGFFSSVHLLPDTDTAIVVLVNSVARNDCADWIGQLLVETVLDSPEKNDFVSLARQSAAKYDSMWAEVESGKTTAGGTGGIPHAIFDYVGKYFNQPRNFHINVVLLADELFFEFQGRASQRHKLTHLKDNHFRWVLTEHESANLGRWPDLDLVVYTMNFEEDDEGRITKIRWQHDFDVPEGEVFTRM